MSSPTLVDTTSKPINGKDGTCHFTIDNGVNTIDYNVILDMIRIREVIEMTTTDTFSVEGVADQEPGRSQIVGEISGVGKKGGPASGPLIPAPQGAAIVATFSTNCVLSCLSNFTEAHCDRAVNQTCRVGARFISKGLYVLTWKLS
jgi:hypothetical protein